MYVVRCVKLGILGFKEVVITAVLSLAVSSAIWLFGVWFLDKVQEKDTPWYYRKWFSLLMLFLFTPLGITLLWAGSRFRRQTKVALTTVFGLLFLIALFTRSNDTYRHSVNEEIANLFTTQKGRVFLKPASSATKSTLLNEIGELAAPRERQHLTPQEIMTRWGNCIVRVTPKDKKGNPTGEASGFLIGKHGAVVTNYHVVDSAHAVSIHAASEEVYDNISLVCANPASDIALLQIEGAKTAFTPVLLGNSDALQVGERVVAIGNPLGLERSLTTGDVSAVRQIGGQEILQISVAISPGSSGGALFNSEGEVVGITTLASFWMAQNLNFAIPINSLKLLIRESVKEDDG
jgi:S1-C subfamily serine protease